jgi:hypothetical protein
MPIRYQGGNNVQPQPSHYKIALEGCNHQVVLTPKEIGERTVDTKYSGAANSGGFENFIVCPRCSGEAGVPRAGDYCMNSVVHRVVMATPMYSSQWRQEQEQQLQELQEQEQQRT